MHKHLKYLIGLGAALVLALGALGGLALASGGQPAPSSPLYGCDTGSSRTLEHVYTTLSGYQSYLATQPNDTCPSGSFEVTTGANGSVTPTPPPTTPPPTTPPPTTPPPTTPPPTGSWTCVESIQANCPDTNGYNDPTDISNSNGYNTYVDNVGPSGGGGLPGETATLSANSPSDWQVSVNTGAGSAGNGSVTGYPDVQQLYTNTSNQNAPLSGFTSITSTYSQSMPDASTGDIAEAAYDIWSNYANDIMIWTDNQGRPLPQTGATLLGPLTVDGVGYGVWRYGGAGGEIILSQDGSSGTDSTYATSTSGSVNIKDVLTALQGQYGIPAALTISEINYGFEVCSTGGNQVATYAISGYTLQTSPSDG
jgi:hypothetical protein